MSSRSGSPGDPVTASGLGRGDQARTTGRSSAGSRCRHPGRSSRRSRRPPASPPRPRRCPRTCGPARSTHVSRPAGRAGRRGRPADHRGERQAAQVGDRRGQPGRVHASAGRPRRRAGTPASCSGWTPTRPATGRLAVVRRFPRGPVLGISPFNFPLNLVAHKVAPGARGRRADHRQAGAGHAAVRAAARRAARRDRPAGRACSRCCRCRTTGRATLVDDPRLPVVSFTGSGPVGWSLAERLPRKHVVLELGGNAAVVVAADYPDLDWAASRIATFSNYQAGQSCIAVQRVYVERPAYEPLVAKLVAAVARARHRRPDRPGHRRRAADQRGRGASGSSPGSARRSPPGRGC